MVLIPVVFIGYVCSYGVLGFVGLYKCFLFICASTTMVFISEFSN